MTYKPFVILKLSFFFKYYSNYIKVLIWIRCFSIMKHLLIFIWKVHIYSIQTFLIFFRFAKYTLIEHFSLNLYDSILKFFYYGFKEINFIIISFTVQLKMKRMLKTIEIERSKNLKGILINYCSKHTCVENNNWN